MNIKPLLKGQTISIDNHQRGDGRPLVWKNDGSIHLHKSIHGTNQDYAIEIALDGCRSVEGQIPKKVKKELEIVFKKEYDREKFIDEIEKVLCNYEGHPQKEQMKPVLDRLASGLGLPKGALYKSQDDRCLMLTKSYFNLVYFITIDEHYLKLGSVDEQIIYSLAEESYYGK